MAVALVMSSGAYSSVFALSTNASVNAVTNVSIGDNDGDGVKANAEGSMKVTEKSERDNSSASSSATSTDKMKDKGMDNGQGNMNASSTRGSDMGESHRSAVANFVQGLLKVADREKGGIGSEVRVIAQEQNDSSTTTIEAINNVDHRSSLKVFFFGSDYKNIGVLRSQMSKTTNRITRLEALVAQSTDDADKATLNAQIQVLENDQTQIDAFVSAHEDQFSLFGWFTKLFS